MHGLFLIAKGQPRLELLENLSNSSTLNYYLKNASKIYHSAYYVDDIENVISILKNVRAKIVSPLKQSVYFGKRICFMMLPNMMMVELIEK